MKITAIVVLKCGSSEENPIILANASDVSTFGFFQRSSVREFIIFVSRTVAKRTLPGQRQSVQHEEYKVHAYNRGGLCALGFMDDPYPVRSAFSLLTQVLDEYQKAFGDSWKGVTSDSTQPWPYLNEALAKYQDPAEADKLLKIQRELDETKIILHKTIDSVLERGERLDSLVEKSSDLSAASQMFYKQAKRPTHAVQYYESLKWDSMQLVLSLTVQHTNVETMKNGNSRLFIQITYYIYTNEFMKFILVFLRFFQG